MSLEASLVRAARRGEREAFGALVARHRPLLVALCRRTLRDAELAEDAAQEAILQAFLGLGRLRHADRFGPWLAGIGLNVCRRWLRERSRESWSWEALLGGRRVGEPLAAGPDPSDQVEAADLAARVRAAVATLPPGQRAAVALFYLAGCSHVETAALLGVPVGAVKTRLHKGRAALRQQLESLWRETTMTAQTAPTDVALRVADVRRHPAEEGKPPRHVVVLEEVGGPRRLPIWVGPFEGTALALLTQGFQPPRPLTFQFAASVLQAAGGRLREVRISRLEGETFYAVAVVEGAAGTVAVDARPSDALSLALTTGARITAAAAVLEAVGAGDPARWAEQERQLYGPGSASAGDILVEVQAQMAAWSSPRREPTPPEGPA